MRKDLVLHPFLFGMFPVLSLYAHNSDITSPSGVVRSLLVTTVLTALLLLLYRAALKDTHKAGVAASLSLLFFLSYGHILTAARTILNDLDQSMLDTGVAVIISLLFILSIIYVASRKSSRTVGITGVLNATSVVMAMSTALTAGYALASKPVSIPGPEIRIRETAATRLPDIYVIILDGYARQDKMKDIYGFDNADFITSLKERGFFVARKATSNYAQTYLSLAATLNLGYLGGLADRLGEECDDRSPLVNMIRNSAAVSFLRERGYRVAAFSSGYEGTEMSTADEYIKSWWLTNEFEDVLLQNTPLAGMFSRVQYGFHRDRVLQTLQRLPELAGRGKPQFVFAHIISPHPPFVFWEDGSQRMPDIPYSIYDGSHFIRYNDGNKILYKEGYGAQARFVSRSIMEMINRLLSKPGPKPVVALMSDHGPGLGLDWDDPDQTDVSERMSILYALYLPGRDGSVIYDGITPVNTFRVIFREYFGADLEPLSDENFFSTHGNPYRFIDVTQRVQGQDAAWR